jgi:hypothetical protein
MRRMRRSRRWSWTLRRGWRGGVGGMLRGTGRPVVGIVVVIAVSLLRPRINDLHDRPDDLEA